MDSEDTLRSIINQMEEWPIHTLPSKSDIDNLYAKFTLTYKQTIKLESLINNHLQRSQNAFDKKNYHLALIEMSRAVQLRPLDDSLRVKLAEIYFSRYMENKLDSTDKRAVKDLLNQASEINPQNTETLKIANKIQAIENQLRSSEPYKFIVPLVFLALVVGLIFWSNKDQIIAFFKNPSPRTLKSDSFTDGSLSPMREVPVNTGSVSPENLKMDKMLANLQQENDSSFIHLSGRFSASEKTIGRISLKIRGRDKNGEVLFSFDWPLRTDSSPFLVPGDSESFETIRWLEYNGHDVAKIDLYPEEIQDVSRPTPTSQNLTEVVWNTPRPDNAMLAIYARNPRFIEAYDRQVLLMDLAVENTGITDIRGITLKVVPNGDIDGYVYSPIINTDVPMTRDERRVQTLSIPYPLDADIRSGAITVVIDSVNTE